jgi:hypothetical protein
MSESVILCEGYHDRAFWTGWLEHLGCENLGRPRGARGRIRVVDPFGNPVTDGEFAFRSKTGKFVRIVPCRGKDKVLPTAESRLKDREVKELVRLVVNVDSDVDADGTSSAPPAVSYQAVEALLRRFGEIEKTEHGDLLLDAGGILVSLVRWEASDPPTPGLPNQQTLERLVSAALVAVYPDRGAAVQGWLDGRPDGPDAGPKEFAWSHMAGWYAEEACEAFYRAVWRDSRVVGELEFRLRQCGAWRVAEALAE